MELIQEKLGGNTTEQEVSAVQRAAPFFLSRYILLGKDSGRWRNELSTPPVIEVSNETVVT